MAMKTQMVMDQESLAAFQQEVQLILPLSNEAYYANLSCLVRR